MHLVNYPDFEKTVASTIPFPGDQCEYKYYLECTDRYGSDYTAFSHMGTDHTRGQFIADIEAMASYYRNEVGLKPQDCVSVLTLTCIEGIITFFALNKIGVIVNFIHPLYTDYQIKKIISDCKSKYLCVSDLLIPSKKDLINEIGLPTMVFSYPAYSKSDAADAETDPQFFGMLSGVPVCGFPETLRAHKGETTETVADDLDYIALYINGGGTTGESKTIMLTNVNINYQNYVNNTVNYLPDAPGDRAAIGCMPFFHAYGLCAGGLDSFFSADKVIYMARFDAEKFIGLLKANKVYKFNGVPNFFRKLLACPDFDSPALANVECIFVGGDSVTADLRDSMYAVLKKYGSQAEFHAGYGLTEAVATCTVNMLWENREGTVGVGVGLDVEIWDEDGNKVPNGTIGEIALTGPQVMAGYLTPTGERGVGVIVDAQGRRWIRTGDLGKLDDDGFVTFAGRKKRVIIISGYNVYPGDIENLVNNLPFVQTSCAVQGEQNGKPIVRLFVQPKAGLAVEKEKWDKIIIDEITEKLVKFNIPRDIRYIDAMPVTKLEKTDFIALQNME